MGRLWVRYRTPDSPADLDAVRERFNAFWSATWRLSRSTKGYAVLN
jgi:hypothetical protein